jgi:RHS repeat-associated protein
MPWCRTSARARRSIASTCREGPFRSRYERVLSYAKDANGSVEALEGEDGSTTGNEYEYDPYGQLEKKDADPNAPEDPNNPTGGQSAEDQLGEDAKDNPFRFQGHHYDADSQTYDMRARAYRPEVGRFLTEDRFESAAGDLALQSDEITQNRYAFAGGNPVNRVEFDGHFSGNEGGASFAMRGKRRWRRRHGENDDQRRSRQVTPSRAYNRGEQLQAQRSRPPRGGARCLESVDEYGCARWNTGALPRGSADMTGRAPGRDQPLPENRCNATGCDNPQYSAARLRDLREQRGFFVDMLGGAAEVAWNVGGPGKIRIGHKGGLALKKMFAGSDDAGRAGLKARGGKRAKPSCDPHSFVAGTLVMMANGSMKPIERVRVGDWVLATDPSTGRTGAFRVTAEIKGRGEKTLVIVTIDGRTTIATVGHPCWEVDRKRWVEAGDLRAGDHVRRTDGTAAAVQNVQSFTVEAAEVFNLTVAGAHNYYAGQTPVLVHNVSPCLNLKGTAPLDPKSVDLDAHSLGASATRSSGAPSRSMKEREPSPPRSRGRATPRRSGGSSSKTS